MPVRKFLKLFFNRHSLVFVGVFAVLLVADQLTKLFIYDANQTTPIRAIPGVINIISARNPGVAFGWFASWGSWVLILIASILTILALIAWWWFVIYRPGRKIALANVGFAFFIAGAVGNLVDRMIYSGAVRDFIQFDFWQSFAVFNFADVFLTIGTVILCVYFIFFTGKKKEMEQVNAA